MLLCYGLYSFTSLSIYFFIRVKGNDTQKKIKNTQKIFSLKNNKKKINDTQKVENDT